MSTVNKFISRKSLIYKTNVEYGDYTINHVLGCSHGCKYPCYAYLLKKRFGIVKTYDDWICPAIVENTMELVNQAFKESIDMMVEDFKNSFAGMNIDDLVDKFNRQKEIDELYLPEFKKYQELNKATNDLNKSLQKTNNTVIKGKMNDLMGEINDKISSGAKMSQYETEIIARRVALLQAEDQLLAARQAKSAVRMTRDNEGNFSYTYTADQEAIGDAQDNYNQHLAELIEYERNANNEIQS